MPPVEVYRRGIRVTRAELIPEPLNHIICGIIDCDHINVKPDRQTLLQDEQFRKLGEALAKSSTNLITHVARNEAALFSEILRSHRKAITRAMIKSDELRLALGQQYTVTRYLLPSSFEPDPDISLGELSRRTSSVLWLADSGRDRALADRAFHLGQVPVVVQHEVEQELLRRICDDIDIRWRHIAEAFIEDMRSRLAHAPRAENLFRRVLPEDCDLICCDDADERLPVRVVRATRRDTQLPSLRGQSGLLLRLLLRALTSDGDQKTAGARALRVHSSAA